MKKELTIAVIGCGLGGATAAALLQRAGFRVALNTVSMRQSKELSGRSSLLTTKLTARHAGRATCVAVAVQRWWIGSDTRTANLFARRVKPRLGYINTLWSAIR